MNRLEEILGSELWSAVAEALQGKGKDGKDMELAIANDGSYIPKAKFDNLNREYQAQKSELAQAQEALAGIDQLQTQRDELEAALTATREEGEALRLQKDQALEEMQRDFYLEKSLTAAGAKNIKAVKALLDLTTLTWEDQELKGIDDQIFNLKEEAPYLFGKEALGEYTPRAGAETLDYSQMSDAEYYRLINRKG